MIPNGEGWHYLPVENFSPLLRRITSKYVGDYYFLNCLHSFKTKIKFESHKEVCESKDFCGVVMASKDTNILEFNQYRKSEKTPSVIYADLKCLIERID